MKQFKKILAVLLCCAMLFTLAACGEEPAKNPKTADVVANLRDAIEFPEMAELTADDLIYYGYDLSAADVEDMTFVLAGSGITADEVCIIKLVDAAKADAVVTMMKARRDEVKNTAASYTPDEVEKLDTAVIGSKGAYVYYACTNDNAKAKEILNNAF